jgi:hypothetical protein
MISVGYLGEARGEAAVREAARFATLTIGVLSEASAPYAFTVVVVDSEEPGSLATAQRILARQPDIQLMFLVPPDYAAFALVYLSYPGSQGHGRPTQVHRRKR